MKKTIKVLICILISAMMLCACGKDKTQSKNDVQPQKQDSMSYYEIPDNMKDDFKWLKTAVLKGDRETTVSENISPEDIDSLFDVLKHTCAEVADFPHSIGIGNQNPGCLTVNFEYFFDESKDSTMNDALLKKADEIAKLVPQGSEYEKIKFIHDYIVDHCDYDVAALEDSNNVTAYTAYGALIDGKAVCEGYSKAFALLCRKVGITALCRSGEGGGGGHMWNMVQCDGKWYNVDVTWDDGKGYNGAIGYRYFLTDDIEMSVVHTPHDNKFLNAPKADSMDNNYFVKNKLVADDYDSAKKLFTDEASKALKNGGHYFTIKLSSKELYDRVINEMMNDSSYSELMKKAYVNAKKTGEPDKADFSKDDDVFVLLVRI